MTSTIQPFSYQSHPLRVEVDADGEPLFHVGDVCAILEYKNSRDALRRHVDSEDVAKRDTLSDGGVQQANWVREPGLWALVLGSHAPGAKAAKRWLTAEVLPALRKGGGYLALPAGPVPAAQFFELASTVEDMRRKLGEADVIVKGSALLATGRKDDVLAHFGGPSATARAVGVTPAAVTRWPDDLTPRIADRAQAAALRTAGGRSLKPVDANLLNALLQAWAEAFANDPETGHVTAGQLVRRAETEIIPAPLRAALAPVCYVDGAGWSAERLGDFLTAAHLHGQDTPEGLRVARAGKIQNATVWRVAAEEAGR